MFVCYNIIFGLVEMYWFMIDLWFWFLFKLKKENQNEYKKRTKKEKNKQIHLIFFVASFIIYILLYRLHHFSFPFSMRERKNTCNSENEQQPKEMFFFVKFV